MKIGITGGTGVVGRALVQKLSGNDSIVCITRSNMEFAHPQVHTRIIGDLAEKRIPSELLADMDVFIHLAADLSPSSNNDVANSNTVKIAKNVADSLRNETLKVVIIVSSIAARLAAENAPNKRQYGAEKLLAENVFSESLSEAHRLIIIRPPLIYGLETTNSLNKLIQFVKRRLPLPFGLSTARRSYLSMTNFCEFVDSICHMDQAMLESFNNKPIEVDDGEAITAAELLGHIGSALGIKPVLLPLPQPFLSMLAKLPVLKDILEPLVHDIIARRSSAIGMNWRPVESMPESLHFVTSKES